MKIWGFCKANKHGKFLYALVDKHIATPILFVKGFRIHFFWGFCYRDLANIDFVTGITVR